LIAEMRPILAELGGKPEWEAMHRGLAEGLDALERATAHLVETDPARAAAGASPYLALFGTVVGGWLTARLALAAQRRDAAPAFASVKCATARFYAEHYLARAPSYLPAILNGATIVDFDPDWL
jgi:3-(methylthio)propanoyl-CoA dehydrogenase